MDHLTPIDQQAHPLAAAPDFAVMLSRFILTRKSERTQDTYTHIFNNYLAHCAAADLDPLRGDAIINYSQALNADRKDKGNGGKLSNDTIRNRLKALASFFTWLHGYGLTPLTPLQVSDMITLPEARKLSPRDILTVGEAAALLDTAKHNRNHCRDLCLIRLMLDAGLRVSEAAHVRAVDVYAADNRHYVHVAWGKGDKSRDVEISPALAGDLWQCGRLLGLDQQAHSRLFPIDRSNIFRMIQRTAGRADIPKPISPHSLRHTHAHQLRLAGWPIELIASRLGHASIETTKLYTRPADLAQAMVLPSMPWQRVT